MLIRRHRPNSSLFKNAHDFSFVLFSLLLLLLSVICAPSNVFSLLPDKFNLRRCYDGVGGCCDCCCCCNCYDYDCHDDCRYCSSLVDYFDYGVGSLLDFGFDSYHVVANQMQMKNLRFNGTYLEI